MRKVKSLSCDELLLNLVAFFRWKRKLICIATISLWPSIKALSPTHQRFCNAVLQPFFECVLSIPVIKSQLNNLHADNIIILYIANQSLICTNFYVCHVSSEKALANSDDFIPSQQRSHLSSGKRRTHCHYLFQNMLQTSLSFEVANHEISNKKFTVVDALIL